MDLEHRIAKLERELRLARLAVLVLASAAIWSSCNKAEPGPATALKAGDVSIDESGIHIDGAVATIALTRGGLEIKGKDEKLSVQIDHRRVWISGRGNDLIAESKQLLLEPSNPDALPRATAWLRSGDGGADLGVQVQLSKDDAYGSAFEATTTRAGTVDRGFHSPK